MLKKREGFKADRQYSPRKAEEKQLNPLRVNPSFDLLLKSDLHVFLEVPPHAPRI